MSARDCSGAPGCEAETDDGPCPKPAAPLPAHRGKHRWARYCWGHLKRKQRKQAVNVELRRYGMSKMEWLMETAYSLMDAAEGGRAGVLRAKDRLRKAAQGRQRP